MAEQHAAAIAKVCRLIEKSDDALSLSKLAAQTGMSVFHFHRVFKAVTGLTPAGYAAANRAKRVRTKLGQSHSVTEAIYDAGFNSNGRFYETSNEVLGMTPSEFRAGGSNTDIFFAIGECSLGSILVAKSERGVCAILLGNDPAQLVRDLEDQFPRANLIGNEKRYEELVAKVVGLCREAGRRSGSAARYPGHGVSAASMAGVAKDPRRLDGELRGDRKKDWRTEIRPGRCPGLRG